METDKILGCIPLQAIIRLMGLFMFAITAISLTYSIRFFSQSSPYQYISFAVFIIYAAPAIAFLMMLVNKEDPRSRKRFHCAYLCSVATNCMFRLFFIVMIVTYYSYYIKIGLAHTTTDVTAWVPSGLMIAAAFILLTLELLIETLIRKRVLFWFKLFYEKVES